MRQQTCDEQVQYGTASPFTMKTALQLALAAGDRTMKTAVFLVLIIALLSAHAPLLQSEALSVVRDVRGGGLLKSQTFLSPPFTLRPGSVSNKYYHDFDFPRGHVAVKSFDAEVVDEDGAPVPLHEAYLHHWLVDRYHAAIPSKNATTMIPARNAGACENTLGQYFGQGAESRRTATWVPDPYGVEAGNPPAGYEERWVLNVHVIDTRGVADRRGCAECRCDLYDVAVDERGGAIAENYTGGLHCCYDQTQCKLKEGFSGGGGVRTLFLRYTVSWLDWSDAVVPVRIYIFDVTDTALLEGKSETACKVEYQIEECSSENRARNDCVHVMVTKQALPRGGDIVFGVAHQHSGGLGASLHAQDGRLLCASMPIYGEGVEAGDEAGYIVGMSTCYPKPGSLKVRDGEVLTVVSNYSSERPHSGAMGLVLILVAEHEQEQQKQKPGLCFRFPVSWCLPAWLSSNL